MNGCHSYNLTNQYKHLYLMKLDGKNMSGGRVMASNTTFNNISVYRCGQFY